ncbi:MAG: hypothetical protein C0594_00545, partial [Marinilabiliales bacterium]
GRVISIDKKNPNSGILFNVGGGILQHKIHIEVEYNNTPQIQGDYVKGYDRLTNGFAMSEFIGYIYFSDNKILNFYGGFEFIQAFTQSRRSYDYFSMTRDTKKRTDLLYSIKIGWIIPLYKKIPQKYYIY